MTRYKAMCKWALMLRDLESGSFEDIERVRNLAGVIERQIDKLPTESRLYIEFNPKFVARSQS